LTNPGNSETSNSAIPTAAQLAETRLKQWHQQGEALLTIENLRGWINATGLVLFAPRPQIASPAPSLVEAVLGVPNATPTIEQTAEARSLLARLVAEGLAVPLNLLGPGAGTVHASAPGDTPDFVVSTAVFSYIFTLRGDKGWKQPPSTSGAMKVSQLALATHDALTRRGPLSAYDLTTEVGKEVTEAAILRALGELWTHLRVLPLSQPDGAKTLWELTSARFTKQIKAGANAGQPSALSALISLYLGQAVVAAEDEIESFLSPLASRSRIRDVIHALLAARGLETIAVEGRTVLHVARSLPAFLAAEDASAAASTEDTDDSIEVAAAGEDEQTDANGESQPRITKFVAKPRKIGTGYLAKAKPSQFAEKAFGAAKTGSFGAKRAFKPGFKDGARSGFKPGFAQRSGAGPAPDRDRRPFNKPSAPGFDKPWDEDKTRRLNAASKPSEVAEHAGDASTPANSADSFQPRAPRPYKPREERGERGGDRGKPAFRGKPSFGSKPSFGDRPKFGDRPAFGDRPKFGSKPSFGDRPKFGDKPAFGDRPKFGGEGRPPRRDFAPRGDGGDARGPRKTFSKPGTFARKREGFPTRSSSDERPPRREFSPRPDRGSDRGDRPSFGGARAAGSYSPRPQGDRPARAEGGSFAPRKPFGARPGGSSDFAGKPRYSKEGFSGKPRERDDRSSTTDSGKRIYRKFDAPRDRPARPYSSDRPARAEGFSSDTRKPAGDFAPRKFAGKSSGKPGKFGAKKPFGRSDKPFTGKSDNTFAKFADNKKPFGKRPPARKFKPGNGESA
jgi:23S rRNA pseudouridine2605 synthase